jgi:hypothetical protein
MEAKLVEFALDMLEPGVARRRARVVGWSALAVGYLWVRSVLLGDDARRARMAARAARADAISANSAARRARVEAST